MRHRMIVALVLALALGLGLASTSSAVAAPVSLKKAIWGPVFRDGVSQFPIYRDLGAGIYETNLKWAESRPSVRLIPRIRRIRLPVACRRGRRRARGREISPARLAPAHLRSAVS